MLPNASVLDLYVFVFVFPPGQLYILIEICKGLRFVHTHAERNDRAAAVPMFLNLLMKGRNQPRHKAPVPDTGMCVLVLMLQVPSAVTSLFSAWRNSVT